MCLDRVVRDDHANAPEPPELLAHQLPDLDARPDVERRQRLVEQKQRGLAHQGPRERDPLRLAAREVAGAGFGAIAQAEGLQRPPRPSPRVRRVDPSRPADRVTRAEAADLHRHVRRILEAAIASNGTTVRDYRTGTGESGNFQLELLVYGREGQSCRVCGTRLVGTHAIDARITVLCHRCQS